jgi:iron complex outermembrane recepter protein
MNRISARERRGTRPALWAALTATTMLTAIGPALAQQTADNSGIETIIVTAEKRSEDIQKVPVSIQALSTEKLEQLHIESFTDYVKYFPSITYTTGGAGGGNDGPGFANVSMRGVVSGNDGNHSGPLPTVGMYLDEQPISTIGGSLDIHTYDIARVEVLTGPQGTLYGASSEAGTIRIITNKPDPSGFSASYDVQANAVDHGSEGYGGEGYINVPVADNAAIRIVAWDEHDAGYIDNVYGTRTYPTSGVTINNAGLAKNNFNGVDTVGARAQLLIDLNDNWTITPSVMGQIENANGVFGYDPSVGKYEVQHYYPEFTHDHWYQAALTVEGKVGDLDLTYSGGHMDRWINAESDYTDYSFWYDTLHGSGAYITDNSGNPVNPSQYILQEDHFTKDSHEIRLTSPKQDRLRFTAGLFYELQTHFILQNYQIADLGSDFTVTGWPHTWWLTDQERSDEDAAAFGEVSFDITPRLTLNGGVRLYNYENRLKGFFGFGLNSPFGAHTGETQCFGPGTFHNDPCTNLDAHADGTGNTHKINLSYQIDDDRMVYFTWSTGFRPGGINRRSDYGQYSPDKLTNYEVGWKTAWLDNTVRFNGALFRENWDDVQFPFLGINSFTIIQNAGNATIQGVESNVDWKPIPALTLSGSGAITDANLDTNYCGFSNLVTKQPYTGDCLAEDGYPAESPAGTQLPITPKYKANLTSRYDFPIMGFAAHVQGSAVYQSSVWPDLRVQGPDPITGVFGPIRSALGKQPAFATFDFSTGIETDAWSVELFVENALDAQAIQYRYAECTTRICDNEPYDVPGRPRLIGIKFGQKF